MQSQGHQQRVTPIKRGGPCSYDLGAKAQARLNGAAIRIDIEVCGRCGGAVRVIVDASNRCIEDQEAIIGFWITCARKNRNYLPSRSCYHAPGATHPSPAGHVASFRGEGRAVAEPAFS